MQLPCVLCWWTALWSLSLLYIALLSLPFWMEGWEWWTATPLTFLGDNVGNVTACMIHARLLLIGQAYLFIQSHDAYKNVLKSMQYWLQCTCMVHAAVATHTASGWKNFHCCRACILRCAIAHAHHSAHESNFRGGKNCPPPPGRYKSPTSPLLGV